MIIKKIKKELKNKTLLVGNIISILFNGIDRFYGGVGLFVKNNPVTNKYSYANWGSRLWEIYLLKKWLKDLNIKDKNVVDLGIGLPSDSDFYKFYVESGCFLSAYDPDDRLNGDLKLSEKCIIYNKSSEDMRELSDNSVDVVVALSSLEHYPLEAFDKTIKEVYRILKKDGSFLVTLDLTFDKEKSANWAILEKTLNGLPAEKNNLSLGGNKKRLTLNLFIKMLSPFFYLKDDKIKNVNTGKRNLVYSKKYNSYIAYMYFYKK